MNKENSKEKGGAKMDYVKTAIKIFSFLSLVGAIFLSTIFYSAWFVLGWFINMTLLTAVVHDTEEIVDVLVCPFLAYVPIGLLYLMQPWINKVYYHGPESIIDPFGASMLIAFIVILIISICLASSTPLAKSDNQKREKLARKENVPDK